MTPGVDGRKDLLPIDEKDDNCGSKGCFLAGSSNSNELIPNKLLRKKL